MFCTRYFAGLIILATYGGAQVSSPVQFEDLRASNPTPTFDHGFVAAWNLHGMHNVTLYAPDGKRMFEVSSFKLADGTKTDVLLSVAIDSDGTSAYVYWGSHGTRSGIAILDTSGNQARVIETEPYKPSQVCFAPDHSLWMFGDKQRSDDLPISDFMTFRHYAQDGKLLGSFVPRSTLPDWQGAGSDQVLAPFLGLWRLRAAKDRIGAALLVGPSKQVWVELSLDGRFIGQWAFTSTVHEAVMPAAYDSNGALYGIRWTDRQRTGVSVFNKSTATWNPVPSLPSGQLLGADGTRLVYQSGDQLRWVQGIDTEATRQGGT